MPGLVRALAASRERLSQELYRVVTDWERTTAMVAEGCVEFVLEAEKRPLVDDPPWLAIEAVAAPAA
jgi:hypothetical protein